MDGIPLASSGWLILQNDIATTVQTVATFTLVYYCFSSGIIRSKPLYSYLNVTMLKPLIHCKHSTHMHLLCIYVENNHCIALDVTLKYINEPYVCFRLALLYSIACIIYHHYHDAIL